MPPDGLVYGFRFMITNGKQRAVTELEAELVRLHALVRERRKQLPPKSVSLSSRRSVSLNKNWR